MPATPTPTPPPPPLPAVIAGAEASEGHGDPVAPHADRTGAVVAALLVVGGFVATTRLGRGAEVAMAVPAAAVVAALRLHRRPTGAHLELVVWLWLLTPFLRRVVDLHTGFHELSPVMLAAPLASMVALPAALRARRRIHADAQRALLVLLAAVGYAFVVGVVRSGPMAPAAAVLTWLPPLAVGLHVATSPAPTGVLRSSLVRLATGGALALGGYAAVQYLMLPDWDLYWMLHAQVHSVGAPEPGGVRVFSTLNSPAPFASTLGALLVVLAATRGRARVAGAGLALAGLGLSTVRMAWMGLVAAVGALVGAGRATRIRRTLLLAAVPVALLLLVDGPVHRVVADRVTASVEGGRDDVSLNDRSELYDEVLPAALRDLPGSGLGASGTSTKVANGGQVAEGADLDSALLEDLVTFGPIVGAAVLVATVGAVLGAWRRARAGDELDRAVGAAAVGLMVQLPFGNPATSVTGVVLFLLVGLLARDDRAAGDDGVDLVAPARPEVVGRHLPSSHDHGSSSVT